MKALVVGILALLVATSAGAQERAPLPEIVIGAPPPSAPAGPPPLVLQPPAPQAPAPMTIGPSQNAGAGSGPGSGSGQKRCADGPPGNDRSLGCLNDKLKKEVDKVNPTANIPPLDAKSADPKIGVISIPGVKQQYGPNFGISAFPYRPAAPVYAPPITHR